jgi:hypothetical protein
MTGALRILLRFYSGHPGLLSGGIVSRVNRQGQFFVPVASREAEQDKKFGTLPPNLWP